MVLSGNEDMKKFGSSNAIEKPDFDIENNDSIFTIEKALFVKYKKGYSFELHDEIKTLKKEIEKLNNELTLTKKRCKKLQTAIDIMKE